MSFAAPLILRPGDDAQLQKMARSAVPAGLVQRATVVLLAAEGLPNAEIGRQVGTTRQTVIAWRARYEAGGLDALADLPRPGRPPVIDESVVIVSTLSPPPPGSAVAHWSARLLADHLTEAGMPISFAEVTRIWRTWGLLPREVEAFAFATDPPLKATVHDVVGLYLGPPTNAVVVGTEDKRQTRAADHASSSPPSRHDGKDRRPRDHGWRTAAGLSAALKGATAKATQDASHRPHSNRDFLAFLHQVAASHAPRRLHVLTDSWDIRDHPDVEVWFAANPHVTRHVAPSSSSWRGMAEILCGIATHRTLERDTGPFAALRAFLDGDQHGKPFRWRKTSDCAEEADRKGDSDTRRYAGKTPEQRRAARRASLVAAGRDLFGSRGFGGTSIRAVLRTAHLQDRYFVESFANLEELLVAVLDDIHASLFADIAREMDPTAQPAEQLRQMLRTQVREFVEDPAAARIKLIETTGVSPFVEDHRRASLQAYVDAIAKLLPEPLAGSGLDRQVLAHGVVSGINGMLVDWVSGSLDITADRLIEHGVELFRGLERAPRST
jgi:AcrR family transcriptional regulator/transposase